MGKLTAKILIILLLAIFPAGCQRGPEINHQKYSDSFFGSFDTLISVVAYTESRQEFDTYFKTIETRYAELHRLYDIYNNYEGINNIKTINDNAGIKPVKVGSEIIDLILFAKDWYRRTGGKTNIAMGAVLRIWHEYREQGLYDPPKAQLPPMEELLEAAKHTDIDKVIVNPKEDTVYLADEDMSLDVGAVAKGFATEIVVREVMARGLESGIINAGGNIRVMGRPMDGIRRRWGIGIQDPEKSIVSDYGDNLLDTLFVNNTSVVSSGDYQRYYIVEDELVHHLIDPDTLMPGKHFKAVTIVAEDSGIADILSTAVFLMPQQQGLALVESLEGVEAVWVMPDGSVEVTDGMKRILKSYGATGA